MKRLGLIVGKFVPLHFGHEWLVSQAECLCDELLILSYTNPEFHGCEVPLRRIWLAQRFPKHKAHVIDNAWLKRACMRRGVEPRELPLNHVDDTTHQLFLAWLLRDVLCVAPDTIFCSEAYGPSCANVLTHELGHPVSAIVVDQERLHIPVSATVIRQDPHACRLWLSPEVFESYISANKA